MIIPEFLNWLHDKSIQKNYLTSYISDSETRNYVEKGKTFFFPFIHFGI